VPTGRRLATLLVVLALVALPAVALRLFCVGESCETSEAITSAGVPFCPLPESLRDAIAAGFREERSPDALGVSAGSVGGVATEVDDDVEVPWPSVGAPSSTQVPIAFSGPAFTGTPPPAGTGLDQIAPTVAQAIGYGRPHPEVRAGTPATGVAHATQRRVPDPLILEIVWKSVGSTELEAHRNDWPFLRSMIRVDGTLEGTTGSLPIDPAATLTTIGTGGLPSQHGITGTMLRGTGGTIARAWNPSAPSSVIATFADDLDSTTGQDARVGGVLTAGSDRGLIGDGWYLGARDRDDVVVSDRPTDEVTNFLDDGYGTDGNPGFIGVVVRDSLTRMDRITEDLVRLVHDRVPRATVVVTATGGIATNRGIGATDVAQQVDAAVGAPIVANEGTGGLFLDRTVSTTRSITANAVVAAMGDVRTSDGSPVFEDTFPSFAVAFSRYC
jgi:hypothetical protein